MDGTVSVPREVAGCREGGEVCVYVHPDEYGICTAVLVSICSVDGGDGGGGGGAVVAYMYAGPSARHTSARIPRACGLLRRDVEAARARAR